MMKIFWKRGLNEILPIITKKLPINSLPKIISKCRLVELERLLSCVLPTNLSNMAAKYCLFLGEGQ